MKRSKEWLAPLTGIVFVALGIAAFALQGEPPSADDEVEEIVSFYVDDKDKIEVGAALATLAAGFLVFFAGYLRKVLRAAEGEGGALSLIAFAGAVVLAVGIAIDATIIFALAEAAEDVDPVAVQSLQALWDNDFFPLALGTLLFLFAAGLSVVRHGALPKWLGWVAIVLAVVAVTPVGFAAFLGTVIWILIVSVMLALRGRRAPESTSAGTLGTP